MHSAPCKPVGMSAMDPPQCASSGPPVQHVPSGMQQPSQLERPQKGAGACDGAAGRQTPVAQLPPHTMHEPPPLQWPVVLPGMHCAVPMSRHPLPQLSGGPPERHLPPFFGPSGMQVVEQFWHTAPALPHAALSTEPDRQVSPSQHPRQLAGPHPLTVWHWPLLHACPGRQNWQLVAPVPHAPIATGSWQTSFESQHPAQFPGKQLLWPSDRHSPAAPRGEHQICGPVHCWQASP
jgi:hypothetical protein